MAASCPRTEGDEREHAEAATSTRAEHPRACNRYRNRCVAYDRRGHRRAQDRSRSIARGGRQCRAARTTTRKTSRGYPASAPAEPVCCIPARCRRGSPAIVGAVVGYSASSSSSRQRRLVGEQRQTRKKFQRCADFFSGWSVILLRPAGRLATRNLLHKSAPKS
jgi:hypothetical protein